MKPVLEKRAYGVWLHPTQGTLRFTLQIYASVPLKHGYVELENLPLTTGAERDVFSMLYPGIDTTRIEAEFAIWDKFEGKLDKSTYTAQELKEESTQGPNRQVSRFYCLQSWLGRGSN